MKNVREAESKTINEGITLPSFCLAEYVNDTSEHAVSEYTNSSKVKINEASLT